MEALENTILASENNITQLLSFQTNFIKQGHKQLLIKGNGSYPPSVSPASIIFSLKP